MKPSEHYAPPGSGCYRRARGLHLAGSYGICDYPLRIVRPGATSLRLLELCDRERTAEELGTMMQLPVGQVKKLCEQLRWKGLLEAGLALPPETWPGVSIILPSYNRGTELERCLRSLMQLQYPATHREIIVVDDASTDGTQAMLDRFNAECAAQGISLRSVRQDARQGVAMCRNRGAALARFELLAFIDSDCVASPGWLSELVPTFSDPTVGAVGAMIRAFDRRSRLGRYEDVHSSLFMGKQEQQISLDGPLTYLPTANLLVRRAAWEKLGGFAPLEFGEDVDFCRRLLLDGARILYLPIGLIEHDYRATLPAFLHTRVSYASSEATLLQLHPATRRVLLLPPEQASFAALVIGGLWGVGHTALHRNMWQPPHQGKSERATARVPSTPHHPPPPVQRLRYFTSVIRRLCAGGGKGDGRRGPLRSPFVLRLPVLAFLSAVALALYGTARRFNTVRKQGIRIHPLVIFRATIRAHLAYTYHLCRHLTRYYTLPMLLVGLIMPPLLVLALVLVGIVIGVDYARLRPQISPGRFALYALLDDCAYEVGVALGCIKQRTWKPLLPIVRRTAASRRDRGQSG